MIIQLDDGTKLEIADGLNDSDIDSIVDEYYAEQAPASAQPAQPQAGESINPIIPTQSPEYSMTDYDTGQVTHGLDLPPVAEPRVGDVINVQGDVSKKTGETFLDNRDMTWRDLPGAKDVSFADRMKNNIAADFGSGVDSAQAIADRIGGEVININGGIAIRDPSGQIGWFNKPGLDTQDVNPAIHQLAAGAVTGGTGLISNVASGLIGTAASQAEKYAAGTFNPEEAAGEAAVSTIAPTLLHGLGAAYNAVRGNSTLSRIQALKEAARKTGGIERPIVSPSDVADEGLKKSAFEKLSAYSLYPRQTLQSKQAKEAVTNYIDVQSPRLSGESGKGLTDIENTAKQSVSDYINKEQTDFNDAYSLIKRTFGDDKFVPENAINKIDNILEEANDPALAGVSPAFRNRIAEYKRALTSNPSFDQMMKNRTRMMSDIKRYENSDLISPYEVGQIKQIRSALTNDLDTVFEDTGEEALGQAWNQLNKDYAGFMQLKQSNIIKSSDDSDISKLVKQMTKADADPEATKVVFEGMDDSGKSAIKEAFIKKTFSTGTRGSSKPVSPAEFVKQFNSPEVNRKLELFLNPDEYEDLSKFVEYLDTMPSGGQKTVDAAINTFANIHTAFAPTMIDFALGIGGKINPEMLRAASRISAESGKQAVRIGNEKMTPEQRIERALY